jgi:hypothetical protein
MSEVFIMKKKLYAIIMSAVLLGTAAVPVSAEEAPGALAAQIEKGLPVQILPFAPKSETDDRVGLFCQYEYQGIAVTVSDLDAVKAEGVGGVPVTWSEGFWTNYWMPENGEFLLQPLTGLAEEYGDIMKYELAKPLGAGDIVCSIPEIPAADGQTVYVLSVHGDDIEAVNRLEAAMAADDRVKALGIVYGSMAVPMHFSPSDPTFPVGASEIAIVPEDGAVLDPADFADLGKPVYAPTAPDYAAQGYLMMQLPGENAAQARALADRIAALPGVAYTAITGSMPNSFTQSENLLLRLAPILHFGSGDLNGDGETNIGDAVLLARFNAEDFELDASTLNMDEADLNADGVTDALDLAELLRQLANTTA